MRLYIYSCFLHVLKLRSHGNYYLFLICQSRIKNLLGIQIESSDRITQIGDISFNDNDDYSVIVYTVSQDIAYTTLIAGKAKVQTQADNKCDGCPQPGDLIVYWNGYEYNHVGVVKHVKDGNIIDTFRSKWNAGAVYDSDPNYTNYGSNWTVWRRIIPSSEKNFNYQYEYEAVNQLILSNETQYKCLGFSQLRLTDKKRNIILEKSFLIHQDHIEEKIPITNKSTGITKEAIEVPFYYNQDKILGFDKYDCRGYVFGKRQSNIVDVIHQICNWIPDYSQVQLIISDGYKPVNAKDTDGNSHNGSVSWL